MKTKVRLQLLLDAVAAGFFCLLVGLPLSLLGLLHANLSASFPLWVQGLLVPVYALSFLALMIGVAFLLARVLPKLEPGRHPLPGSKGARSWGLHFALQRVVYLPLWRPLIFSFSTLRWALLRALGARCAFEMSTASDVQVLDASMMTIEEGVMMAAGVVLSGHLMENGELVLAHTRLGRGAQLLESVKLAPGVSVGVASVIGPETLVGPNAVIGSSVFIGAACLLGSDCRLGDKVVLGHQVSIESNVEVGEGCVVQTGARLVKGTRLAAGERFPPRRAVPG